jgi:hypothetical protein
MPSSFLKLNLNDFARGLGNAVIGAALFAFLKVFQDVVGTPDFNLLAVDWGTTFFHAANVAFTAGYYTFASYIGTKLVTDESGTIHLGALKIEQK